MTFSLPRVSGWHHTRRSGYYSKTLKKQAGTNFSLQFRSENLGCKRWNKDLAHAVRLPVVQIFCLLKKNCWNKPALQRVGKIVWLRITGRPHSRFATLCISNGFCSIIRAIYDGRKFVAHGAPHMQQPGQQNCGIFKTGPLSVWLFSIGWPSSSTRRRKIRKRSWHCRSCRCPSCQGLDGFGRYIGSCGPYPAGRPMWCRKAWEWIMARASLGQHEGCEVCNAARDGSVLTCKNRFHVHIQKNSCIPAALPGLAGAEVGRQQRGTKGKFDKYLSSFIFHSCVVSKVFDCLHTMGLKAMLAT